MSTRSLIGKLNGDESVTAIYCHFDGYPSNNGRILKENYMDAQKVNALLALGDLSSLGEEIGTKHSFDNRPDGECTAYRRDRGETGTKAVQYASVEAYREDAPERWAEYAYLFTDRGWLMAQRNHAGFSTFKKLTKAMLNE